VKENIKNILLKTGIYKALARRCEKFAAGYWMHLYKHLSAKYSYPVWFPHRLDLALWFQQRNAHFLERGVYSSAVIAPGDTVLELCCGDGFYSYFFFSCKAAHVDAVDIDDLALAHAGEFHACENVQFHKRDIIREPFPRDRYNVVVWDSAMRRLKKADIKIVLQKVRDVLEPTQGIFSCYVIIDDPGKPIEFIEPLTAEELTAMLRDAFDSVVCVESVSPDRHNYYFHCFIGQPRQVTLPSRGC
jgi:ubiquinone/menaquinone biosynthesis C-methylase UbiE